MITILFSMASLFRTSKARLLHVFSVLPLFSSMLFFTCFPLSQAAHAEDVIFIVPNSSDPASVLRFDPPIQIIEKGQSITFVNPDGVDHQLVVKSANNNEEFDTGVLSMNKFVSHTFSENGEYNFECKIYPHMKGEIKVTDDIVTFSKPIDNQNLDVQLTRTPATPGVNEEIYYKITFIDKETGRNHPHIDFALSFNDSSGNYVDGTGGHTVDGQEFAAFEFDEEDAFTPAVTVSGVNLLLINPETVTFDILVTPEFPPSFMGIAAAAAIGATLALYRRKSNHPHLS